MTRAEIRNMKKSKIFKELLKVINSCFKDLLPKLNSVKDARDKRYITYKTGELLYVMLMAKVMTIESMNDMTEKFNTDECIENFKKILGNEKLEELPHHDTINAFLEILDSRELENIRKYMIKEILKRRMFDQNRFFKKWLIVFDGTGLYYYKKRHCEHCLTTTHTNKETGEKTTRYFHKVLEAKLVVGDFVFSIGTEFIENEKEAISKQDCEIKAFKRLAKKIKNDYKRLPICILADSLYVKSTIREICRENNWGYVLTYKKGSSPTIWREYEEIFKIETGDKKRRTKEIKITIDGIKIARKYKWVNEIPYNDEQINIVQLTEIKNGKKTRFVYMSSKKINYRTVEKIVGAGRRRWKIENEGFNVQKNCGYRLEHEYSKNGNAMKNHYLILQLAHMIRQLYDKGVKGAKQLKTSIKKESYRLLLSLTSIRLTTEDILEVQNIKIQLRFE